MNVREVREPVGRLVDVSLVDRLRELCDAESARVCEGHGRRATRTVEVVEYLLDARVLADEGHDLLHRNLDLLPIDSDAGILSEEIIERSVEIAPFCRGIERGDMLLHPVGETRKHDGSRH